MIRKIVTAGVVAGALAVGTASASSLGGPDNGVTIASSTIDVDGCELEEVDFSIGQNIQGQDVRTGEYYTQQVDFTFTQECVGETLDFRVLGAVPSDDDNTDAGDLQTLVSSFNNEIDSMTESVSISKTFVEDIEALTVAVH